MLEIRYNTITGEITAWAGSPRFKGGHLKPKDGEAIVVFRTPNPLHSPEDYLIVDGKLKLIKEPSS